MSEFIDNISEVPERIVVSGDGLRNMGLTGFNIFVRTLGSMGLTVNGMDQLESDAIRNPEAETEDTPLYKSDFIRIAENNDIDKSVATKTWGCLTYDWDRFKAAKRKQIRGLELSYFEKRWLSKLPEWRQDLCPSDGKVSYAKLCEASESELLIHIWGIGPVCLDLIQKVIDETKEKLSTAQEQLSPV